MRRPMRSTCRRGATSLQTLLQSLAQQLVNQSLNNALPAIPIPAFPLPASLSTVRPAGRLASASRRRALTVAPQHFTLTGKFGLCRQLQLSGIVSLNFTPAASSLCRRTRRRLPVERADSRARRRSLPGAARDRLLPDLLIAALRRTDRLLFAVESADAMPTPRAFARQLDAKHALLLLLRAERPGGVALAWPVR